MQNAHAAQPDSASAHACDACACTPPLPALLRLCRVLSLMSQWSRSCRWSGVVVRSGEWCVAWRARALASSAERRGSRLHHGPDRNLWRSALIGPVSYSRAFIIYSILISRHSRSGRGRCALVRLKRVKWDPQSGPGTRKRARRVPPGLLTCCSHLLHDLCGFMSLP